MHLLLPVGVKSEAAAPSDYQIARSLRFNSADSAYMQWTPSTFAANGTLACFSFWVKRAAHAFLQSPISAYNGSAGTLDYLQFSANDTFQINLWSAGGASAYGATSSAVYRDISAWMHFFTKIKTSEATSTDRFKVWVNGVQIAMSAAGDGFPALNFQIRQFFGNFVHRLGSGATGSMFTNAYFADVIGTNGIDNVVGDFGEFDATTGVWKPKQYAGAFGTNGFWYKFADNSAATAAAIGKDSSPNGLNATPTNLSVTAGNNDDSVFDSPTSFDDGNAHGNYCTLSHHDSGGPNSTVGDGNLRLVGGTDGSVRSTIWIEPDDPTGYYFEANPSVLASGGIFGVGVQSNHKFFTNSVGWTTSGWDAAGLGRRGTNVWNYYLASVSGAGGTSDQPTTGIACSTSDILQVAIKQGKVWLGINNTWTLSGNPSAGTGQLITLTNPVSPYAAANATGTLYLNFGQRAFTYAPPTGFKSVCAQNLPVPSIPKSSAQFDINLRTGTLAPYAVSGKGFSPDLIWIKNRSGTAFDHSLWDVPRGPVNELYTPSTIVESSQGGGVTSFDATGYGASNGSLTRINTSGAPYVEWLWNAGNTPGLFIGTFTAQASGVQAVPHGLGVTPKLTIVKNRTLASGWYVWHAALSNPSTSYIMLNSSSAATSFSTMWGASGHDSTNLNFTIGGGVFAGHSCVAYAFAEVPGFSRFGSYYGNSSTNGVFQWCGFRPKFVVFKNTATAGAWWILDATRAPYNGPVALLFADETTNEYTTAGSEIDLYSNGFKHRHSGGQNAGYTYMFFAFAENPFKHSRAR